MPYPDNSPKSQPEMKPIDIKTVERSMQKMFDLPPEEIFHILNSLQEELRENARRLETALEQGDMDTIFQAAHAIRGALLNAGLAEWSRLARRLEYASWKGDQCDFQGCFQDLQVNLRPLLDRKTWC